MKREEDQDLWNLLGKLPAPPRLSPFFARNVLREIRQERGWREKIVRWLVPRRLVPASAVALAVFAAALSLRMAPWRPNSSESVPDAVAQLDDVDYEVVADLEDLLAADEDNLWTENETSTL